MPWFYWEGHAGQVQLDDDGSPQTNEQYKGTRKNEDMTCSFESEVTNCKEERGQ